MARICSKCQKEYQDSMNFCLDDGSLLSDLSSEATLIIPDKGRHRDEPKDADARIKSILVELYMNLDFAEFEFDARFERLIDRYRTDSFEKVFQFLSRLYGRSKVIDRKGGENYDPTALMSAITSDTEEETDSILRKNGLL